jgi:poly(3-hydroxybutyrate) depolymerase
MATRRAVLLASLGASLSWAAGRPRLASAAAGPAPSAHFEIRELRLAPGEAPFGGRVPVLVPRHLAEGARVPLVVALHGLGETGDPALAARAWPELYGLGDAYGRLREPPIQARGRRGDLPPDRVEAINRALAARPLEGLVVACPFTPNPAKARDRGAHLDAYARWLVDVVASRAREQLSMVAPGPSTTHLAGCSMGGSVAIDVALRARGSFGALAIVQSAHGAHRNAAIAAGLAAAGPSGKPLPTLVLTSRGDPFRARNEALARELAARGVPHEARVLPGPHDQPWLREAGTPEMLLWLDRRPRR